MNIKQLSMHANCQTTFFKFPASIAYVQLTLCKCDWGCMPRPLLPPSTQESNIKDFSTNYYFKRIYLNFSCERNDCVLSLSLPKPLSHRSSFFLAFPFSVLDLALPSSCRCFSISSKIKKLKNLGFEFPSSLSLSLSITLSLFLSLFLFFFLFFFLNVFPLPLK
jgi:hypothetical protein